MLGQFRLATILTVITLPTFSAAPAYAEPLKVVASFSIIGDFASNVGGDRIELKTLVGPDGDAHLYEPRPADAVAMSAADIVLVNGLQFEGFLKRLAEASGTKATIVELSNGIETLRSDDGEHHHEGEEAEVGHADGSGHDHGAFDPHAWQSVANAQVYVNNVAAAFCNADNEGCDTYKSNAARYLEKLAALDTDIKDTVAAIPEDKRTIITSHDAFKYFEHEYGLKFLAPEGVSTEAEASAADVAALIRQIREDKASAIFVENITNQRLIEQIASETGIRIGGTLYSDALSGNDGPAATYIDMMRNNISVIKAAIQSD
ncbi:MAG: zinc ABC transporter substrate-binding protein AztC [Phyllobacterium sp.]